MSTDYVGTRSGRRFYFHDPKPDQIDPEDIAHALAHTNRFNGHARVPYSVAQHSIRVAELLERRRFSRGVQLAGLLHDAAEAYLGDIVSPVKAAIVGYTSLESDALRVIFERCGVAGFDYSSGEAISQADYDVFCVEVTELFLPTAQEQYGLPANIPNDVKPMTSDHRPGFWRAVFLNTYHRLGGVL